MNDPMAEKASRLDDLGFLLGEWQAVSQPGEPTGRFTFTAQVQSRVIVRTNYADYAATNDRPAYRHEDLMVIYEDEQQQLRADYYDSEGHVIRYAGNMTAPNAVVFTSEPAQSGPGFRLSYQLRRDGELQGTFEIAAPNSPGAFAPYLAWTARRR